MPWLLSSAVAVVVCIYCTESPCLSKGSEGQRNGPAGTRKHLPVADRSARQGGRQRQRHARINSKMGFLASLQASATCPTIFTR